MRSLAHFLKNPKDILSGIMSHTASFWPDQTYLRIVYNLRMGKCLNLDNPKSFTEKLQWLKIHNRQPVMTTMVDKLAVKDYVAKIIGQEYVIPTLGAWSSFDDIELNSLPEKFVLKTSHGGGGGGVLICRDKSSLDMESIRVRLEPSFKSDIFKQYREWPYKDVPRRIIAEELIETKDNRDLKDYKFFCFNGCPKFFKVDYGRFTDHHANYYDMEWNLLPFGEADYPPQECHKELIPPNYEKMVELATSLSVGHPFLRVDLYNVSGKIYFGELTFFPASGLGRFSPEVWDEKIGAYLKLNN